MEWKRAVYSNRNPGRPVLAVVTPLDIREAASAASPTPVPPPFPSPELPPFPFPRSPPSSDAPLWEEEEASQTVSLGDRLPTFA